MNYLDTWQAIDRLAEIKGLSRSGLAKACGLNATTFNPCKRTTKFGQPRWLNGQTMARVMEFAQMTPAEFFALGQEHTTPIIQ